MDNELKSRLEDAQANKYINHLDYRNQMKARNLMLNRFSKYRPEKEKKMKTLTATISKKQNAPEFVFGSFGFKAEDLVNYCNSKGYINFDILAGKESGYYVKVSDYGVEN